MAGAVDKAAKSMAAHSLKLIEDPQGMMFEYLNQDEAEFLYEVRSTARSFAVGQ